MYGIVDRFSPGADADFLISQIVSDILPFDRTDHVLNNNPSDREVCQNSSYCYFHFLIEIRRTISQVTVHTIDNQSAINSTDYYLMKQR